MQTRASGSRQRGAQLISAGVLRACGRKICQMVRESEAERRVEYSAHHERASEEHNGCLELIEEPAAPRGLVRAYRLVLSSVASPFILGTALVRVRPQ